MPDATTFNPDDKHASVTLSNGDMTASVSSEIDTGYSVRVTDFLSSGKYYIEFELDTLASSSPKGSASGFGESNASASYNYAPGGLLGSESYGFFIDPAIGSYGAIRRYRNGSQLTLYEKPSAPAYAAGDILQLAIDLDNGDIWVGVNNTWVGDPAAGTGASVSGWSFYPSLAIMQGGCWGSQVTLVSDPANQTYSPPSGFAGKWAQPVTGDITGALGSNADIPGVKEINVEITAALGSFFDDTPQLNNEIEAALPSQVTGAGGVMLGLRDRSPITGDAGLSATFDMFRGHWGYPDDGAVQLGAVIGQELEYELESIWVSGQFGASAAAINSTNILSQEIVRLFEFTLTGSNESPPVADIVIPISSIQARLRSGTPTYLSVQIPSYSYIDQISARSNGTMIVEMVAYAGGVEQTREIIAQADLDDIRSDRGGRNRTISLTGYKTETYTDQNVTLTNVIETGESGGKKRVVADIDFYLKPGQTVIIPDFATFTAGLVSLSISVRQRKMEVTEA